LKLAGESGLLIDRIERTQVEFLDPAIIRSLRDTKQEEKAQLEIDFDKQAAGGAGPADMGEGFTCTYSGACPRESKSCEGCEFAGSIFQHVDNPPADAVEETPAEPVVEGEPTAPTLADEMKASEFASWATMSPEERNATGVEKPIIEQPVEVIQDDEVEE
jgi:hypothetical protein